jgi:hypothetical protein
MAEEVLLSRVTISPCLVKFFCRASLANSSGVLLVLALMVSKYAWNDMMFPYVYGANGLGFMPIFCASICDLERVRRRTLSAQEQTLQAKHYVLVPRVFCASHVS